MRHAGSVGPTTNEWARGRARLPGYPLLMKLRTTHHRIRSPPGLHLLCCNGRSRRAPGIHRFIPSSDIRWPRLVGGTSSHGTFGRYHWTRITNQNRHSNQQIRSSLGWRSTCRRSRTSGINTGLLGNSCAECGESKSRLHQGCRSASVTPQLRAARLRWRRARFNETLVYLLNSKADVSITAP